MFLYKVIHIHETVIGVVDRLSGVGKYINNTYFVERIATLCMIVVFVVCLKVSRNSQKPCTKPTVLLVAVFHRQIIGNLLMGLFERIIRFEHALPIRRILLCQLLEVQRLPGKLRCINA